MRRRVLVLPALLVACGSRTGVDSTELPPGAAPPSVDAAIMEADTVDGVGDVGSHSPRDASELDSQVDSASDACAPQGGLGQSVTLGYTGAPQGFVIPEGVTRVTLSAYGAAGGAGFGGTPEGGCTRATLSVTPGETLAAFVGGQGANAETAGEGGFNGGGHGGSGPGGGGASDVRQGGSALENRVVVAGGGGGAGSGPAEADDQGGPGGALVGGDAGKSGSGGGGGKQERGGAGGEGGGTSGTLGIGGDGAMCASNYGAGGGGGGYYGGGGGGCFGSAGGGGGGSSFAVASASNVTMAQGVRTGSGKIVVVW